MEKKSTTKIREIFTSIQGEGPYIGQKHIFVRFCRCNLKCSYCDTDFDIKNAKEYTQEELYNALKQNDCDTISFTGGEPLLELDFLKTFLEKYKKNLNKKIYLETNGTLSGNLAEIIDYIDVVSADIKINSATKQQNCFEENDKFFQIAIKKDTFIKIVFDKNITQDEIDFCVKLAQKYNILIVLQPKMPMDSEIDLIKIYDMFYEKYKNIQLIPQVHKYLNLA